jgi:hypothetical protein
VEVMEGVMHYPKLSSKEKKRINRCMSNVKFWTRHPNLEKKYGFIKKRQMEVILFLLGRTRPTKVLVGDGLEIMKDPWPFKKYRLKRLIEKK